jgi:hypothetical protein
MEGRVINLLCRGMIKCALILIAIILARREAAIDPNNVVMTHRDATLTSQPSFVEF